MEEKVRIRDKLDSELAALNESVEEIIEKQREREDREAAKYKAELDTLRASNCTLVQTRVASLLCMKSLYLILEVVCCRLKTKTLGKSFVRAGPLLKRS